MAIGGFFITGLVAIASVTAAHAMTQEDYLAALKIADQKVARERAAANNPQALSSAVLGRLYGRYYQVGDTWDIAAWVIDNAPTMRPTNDAAELKPKTRKGGVFRYEVVEVKNGPEPSVVIKVTQLDSYGMRRVDPKIETLTLTMNDRLMQSEKAYKVAGHAQPVRVAAQGVRSPMTELELFPLDVPEIVTAALGSRTTLPELPEAAQALASQVGWKPDLSKSQWFEQDDFFGRPVQILWQFGDPWPTYFKTPNGIAVLIRK